MPDAGERRGWWRGRRVLVTGGAGFLGSNLVARLLELGARVRVADSRERTAEPRGWEGGVDFRPADLRDPRACREVCAGQEVVFHCASRVGSNEYYRRHPGSVLGENLLLDAQMLAAAAEAGVARYLYPSSSMVYPRTRQQSPDAPALKEDEALPADPPNSYGWAKLIGEKAVESVAAAETGRLRAALLRLENVYGPGQDIDLERGSLLPVLVRRALDYPQMPFRVRGTGRETRCYCYVTDAVEACLRGVEALADRRVVGPLNVSGDERVSVGQLVEEVVRLSGKDIRVEWIPGETPLWGQVVDCRRAQAELNGWRAVVPLAEGIRRLFADVAARLEAGERQPVG
jgi:GDP-D-mannose 3',5'-epimerase